MAQAVDRKEKMKSHENQYAMITQYAIDRPVSRQNINGLILGSLPRDSGTVTDNAISTNVD